MVDSSLYQLDAYDYALPAHLIAKYPLSQRDSSRLLDGRQQLDAQQHSSADIAIEHRQFVDLIDILKPGDCLVLNDTQVIKARLFGQKATGGRVEVFIIQHKGRCGTAFIQASKSPKAGSSITIKSPDGHSLINCPTLEVTGQNQDGTYTIEYAGDWLQLMASAGHLPLPPYMERQAQAEDEQRYQTIWACKPGAVAAPTASLHFSAEMLKRLQAKGVDIAYLTLHVGAGTFAPVRVDDIRQHQMHSEYYQVSNELLEQLRRTQAKGQQIVAVGTTVLRALETLAQKKPLAEQQASTGHTDIFIFPGFECKVVDLLLTNFHLPKSTLLMLVSAFAGKNVIDAAYQQAITQEYRFFSYGDAMLLNRAAKDVS